MERTAQALGEIEMAGPGYWGPEYRGIMAVLITEFSGQQPVTASFNVGEKKGVAQLDFAPVQPGKSTPQLNAYNARSSKLNLASHFLSTRSRSRNARAAGQRASWNLGRSAW